MELVCALALLTAGVAAGFASGMLGVGGCFIMVPVQLWALTSMGVEPTLATRISFGTALAVALPTAINAAIGHRRRGAVDQRAALLLGITGLVGAFFGGYVAAQASGAFLRIAFGLVILAAALRMLMGKDYKTAGLGEGCDDGGGGDGGVVVRDGGDGVDRGDDGCTGNKGKRGDGGDRLDGLEAKSDSCYLLMGLPLGFLCGLIGIGGGVIMVPVLSTVMGFGMHRAVGTSAAAIILTSSGGVLSYVYNGLYVPNLPPFSLGYVNLLQWALLAGTSIPAALVGVRVAHLLPAHRLRAVFTIVMIYVALEMMGVFEQLRLPI